MDRPSRFLITTADERTWRTDHPVLCLGAWCCTYSRTATWEKLKAEIAPYHWDDRDKLYRDYLFGVFRLYHAQCVSTEWGSFLHREKCKGYRMDNQLMYPPT